MKYPLLASCLVMALLSACAGDKPAASDKPKETVVAAPPPAPPAPPVDTLEMTPGDVAKLQAALQSLTDKPVNESANWYNAETRMQGTVKILRDGYDAQNHPCREFASTVMRDPLFRQQTGFVCHENDGSWKVEDATDYPLSKRQS